MKIIYHCFGGSHSSVTAAAIHLGMLDKNRLPSNCELMRVPYYDKTHSWDFGTIHLMGVDDWGNEIYVLGKKSMGGRYVNILAGISEILGVGDELFMVDCMKQINWMMKIGGFTSRRVGLPLLGRPMVLLGTKCTFFKLTEVVENTRLIEMQFMSMK